MNGPPNAPLLRALLCGAINKIVVLDYGSICIYEIEMFSVYFFVFFCEKILHFPKKIVNIFVNFCAVEKIMNNFMEVFT